MQLNLKYMNFQQNSGAEWALCQDDLGSFYNLVKNQCTEEK